jgi:F-box protein 11
LRGIGAKFGEESSMTATVPSWQGLDLGEGRYHITGRIPGGGMAEVYKAWDRNLQTEVIIKIPLPELYRNPTFAARFSREVRTLVQLAHPNVVKVLDVGEHSRVPFAVMQFLAGGSLRDRQVAGPNGAVRPMPPAALAGWLSGVAAALDFIHARGFIHRDVKPGNILFDAHGHPYLADFGVIKALAAEGAEAQRSNLTQRGTVLGTLQYLAPEVLLMRRFDGRADQFALAVTVYEVLAGRYPFQGGTPADIMSQQMTTRPRPLHELIAGVSPALGRAVARGLSREPDERFPDCASFARAVLEAVHVPATAAPQSAPVPAPPPGAAGNTAPLTPGQVVRLACPLCEEMLGLTPALAGKRVRCPSCKAELLASGDLRRVTVASKANKGMAVSAVPPPPEQPPAPQTFGLSPSTEEVPPPMTFSIPIDSPEAEQIRAPAGPPTMPPPAQFQAEQVRASVPTFLPDEQAAFSATPQTPFQAAAPNFLPGSGGWEAQGVTPPRSGKGFKVFALVCLCLVLLGGLAFGTYYALQHFQQPSEKTEKADKPEGGNGDDPRPKQKTEPGPRAVGPKVVVAQKGGGDFTTLKEALAAAPADAVISVRPGVYRESVVLTKPVQLLGDGKIDDIVIEAVDGPCVKVQTDTALLRDLTLRGKAGPVLDVARGQPVVEGCDIASGGAGGVAVHGPLSKAVLRKCKVHDSKGPGVLLHTSAACTLEDCEVYANEGPGVEVRQGAAPEMRKCVLRDGQGAGLLVHLGGKGEIDDCEFVGNAAEGVLVKESANPTLRRCKVYNGKREGLVFLAGGRGTVEDCSIYGNAAAGVAVSGSGTAPLIRKSTISDGKGPGLVIANGAAGSLEDCTLAANTGIGVQISAGATTLLRKCRVYDGKNLGVAIQKKSAPRLEECWVYRNALTGVEVSEGAEPALLTCKIYDGKSFGLNFHTDARGTLDDCDVYGNATTGMVIGSRSAPVLRKCKFHHNLQDGLMVWAGGGGEVDTCTFYENGFHGAEVRDASNPTLKHCKFHDGKKVGVYVWKDGKCTLDDCEISGHAEQGVFVSEGGDPLLRNCKIHDGKSSGIRVFPRGKGTLENCDVYANAFVGVWVDGGTLQVRKSTVRDDKNGGVIFENNATGTLEETSVSGHVLSSVTIRSGADLLLRQCKVHDGKSTGIWVEPRSKGTLENCDVYANALVGVWVNGGTLQEKKSTIRDGKNGGVLFENNATGTMEETSIFGNGKAAVTSQTGARPVLRQCKIFHGKDAGVLFFNQGKGSVIDCRIYRNALAGVELNGAAGGVLVSRCKIYNGQTCGVLLQNNASGRFTGCEIFGNGLSGVESRQGGSPALLRCTISGNKEYGIFCHQRGSGSANNCNLRNNGKGPTSVNRADGSSLTGQGNTL